MSTVESVESVAVADPQEWIDDRELTRRTPISRARWQLWRYQGEGPVYYKVGRRILYRWSEVEAWLKSGAVTEGGAQ